MTDAVELRHLSTPQDYVACLELQRQTWGEHFQELVPPTILRISQKVSGVAAGAFRGDSMLGFVYGLSGVRDGRLAHWSHMLAVTPEARGLGLGKRLKYFQRAYLLEQGVEVMYWTYDPLVARNARLNLNRLRARPVEYVRDMYGADTGSELHSALGTDRFVVGWELRSPEVAAAEEGATLEVAQPAEDALLLNADLESGEVLPEAGEPPDSECVWVEIPADIEEVKARDRTAAAAWRTTSRQGIERSMAAGYEVVGLSLGRERLGGRAFYLLTRSRGEE